MLRPTRKATHALAAFAVFAACATTPVGGDGVRQQPGWASALREQARELPQLGAHEPSATNGPTPSDLLGWRGEPRDLTQRLDPPARRSQVASAAPRAGGNAGAPVVIQLQTGASQPANEPAAPSPLSAIERRYARDRELDASLLQFGYEQLQRPLPDTQSGPVPDGYVVGPGDEVSIVISGSFSAAHRATVDRDGRLRFPDAPVIEVGGREFRELEQLITAAYAVQRRAFEVSVGLGRLRRIRVQVAGQVANPGFVEIPAMGTPITAVRAAGGVNKAGSLRRLQLRRAGALLREVDAYDFLLTGDAAGLPTLRDDDLLFVPPIGATYAIHGAVAQAGIYELHERLTLAAAMQRAGGVTAFAFTPRVQVERTEAGRGRVIEDVALDEAGRARLLADGDVVAVGDVDSRQQAIVDVEGEVVRPGRYQHRSGLRLRQLIELADGLTLEAHSKAIVSRVVASPRSVRWSHAGPPDATRRQILVVDLERVMAGDPEHDLALQPLDLVSVRSRARLVELPKVSVLGAVRRPGTYELTPGLRVSDLVVLADNVVPEVYYAEAELIRWQYDAAGGELDARRYRFHLGKALDRPGSATDPVLENGDRLIIRSLRRNSVEVSIGGEVRFPGTYVFGVDAKITDLIAAAGGLLPSADLRTARFTRKSVAALQADRIKHLAERTRRVQEIALEQMVQTGTAAEGLAAKIALENSKEVLARIQKNEPQGRIVLPFDREDFPSSAFNLALENGDALTVPRYQRTVSVLGHVFNPGSFVAERGLTVADVVDWSGGLTEAGDHERLYVIRGTGRVQSLSQDHGRLRMETALLPGDVVLVPRRPLERTLGARLADLIHVTRELTEIAVLGNSIVSGGQVDVTAVIQNSIEEVLQSTGTSLLRDGR